MNKSGNCRLLITCSDILSQHAFYTEWVKQSAEMAFSRENNTLKSGLSRMSGNSHQLSITPPMISMSVDQI